MKRGTKVRAFRGVTTACAAVLALSVTATSAVAGFRTDINRFLGTHSTEWTSDPNADPSKTYTYKSDYTNTKDLVLAARDLGERVSEEGSVLLKNNGALPLTPAETGKISLLGFSSYNPVQGGDMGSSVSINKGTDADTVDMVQAFKEKGFTINPTLEKMYDSMKDQFTTEINNWGNISTVTRITAPMIGAPFTSKEPSQEALDKQDPQWKASLADNNVMIVTIARSSGENRNYTPGTAGVDPQQKLNQSDPLGLSDDERNLINAAVTAKQENGGKVIVLVNAANAMQLQEVQDNAGVDAIMQIGLPGAYGFYGIADLLSGAATPSGHLSDTWVSNNQSTPAAVNYGDYQWKNADPRHNINSELVQAEGIYTGYKYYETRYMDVINGAGNASSTKGSTDGSGWDYYKEVTYPFGYGMSYTTFSQTLDDVSVNLNEKTVTAHVTVTNTGAYAGKDVAQLYVSTPYTDYDKRNNVEKAGVQLLDYAKTKELQPGESQTLTITADAQYMASWDSSAKNAAGTKGNYILDAGQYTFALGNGAHAAANNVLTARGEGASDGVRGNTSETAQWSLDALDTTTFASTKNGTKVENQLADADLNKWMPGTVTYLSRSDWDKTWPKVYEGLTATDDMLKAGLTNDTYQISANSEEKATTWGASGDLTLADLKGVKSPDDKKMTELMNQMKLSEAMIRTAFGGTSTKPLVSISSPEVIQNDGPNGFASYPLGQYANKDKSSGDPYAIDANDKNANYSMGILANESILGQTFSKELAQEWGKLLGNYSIWANTTILWGLGTNLHRNAYNARNHEYFSEDPMLTALQATAAVQGGQEYGIILAAKHYAFNDTEINRIGIAVFMNEQKAREGELRAHQSEVEDGHILGMMTGYNRIGVTAANANTGLMLNILRKEWGFQGLLSEDFIMDNEYKNLRAAAFNGITMTTSTGEDSMQAVEKQWPYWNERDVSQDSRLSAALKRNMTWQYYAFANSNAMDGLNDTSRLHNVRTWYDNVLTAMTVAASVLTLAGAVMYILNRRKYAIEGRSLDESVAAGSASNSENMNADEAQSQTASEVASENAVETEKEN
ncbi:beta-glucosidase-related glycosidase [Alloscardovia theropitheci]|uniref:Beta-glucosidase-related glycosidase n=1 Tax=Alloscardovia theropitheci TaxID=2496842 RepID=A0A4R0QXN1_9BIFI|nr:glycoside hydrolase family 3 C-terminal domain-containing protein [Alloscardovia theropitheci]TCD54231.1 beta-glucosidase-related glycosidase [Alloscardovia theropitheci]